ncbi:DUF5050 domain-containing protein [uncultured Catenibacterium sp.]|uniref:DUF5050 domain-containing protein n=1 Tax=uncultured Catenibacterium sp. TaxID=286142 RepID=UPI0025F0CD62|nr:DUF5050 domain-containing protein [uncultured Catenibacterium sp.]
MICPSCHKEVPVGSHFCPYCGTPLDDKCPYCGHQNIPDAKFCSSCGKPLGPATATHRPQGSFTPTSRIYQEEEKTYEPEKVSHKINWKVVIVSVLVLILATTGAKYYLNHSGNIKWADGNSSTTEEITSIVNLKKTTDLEQYSNLANDGYVAANDQYIFMSNADNQLVKLDKDMNVVKTYDVKYATYLNLVGEKLYYTDKDHHICVLDTKTEKTETLQDVSAFYMTYHDNKLYYQNDGDNESLYVYDISSKTSTKLLDEHIYNMNFNGDIIYLTGKSSIISYNMTTKATETIYDQQVYGSVYKDGYLYFSTPKMAIGRVNVETKESETIMDDIGYSVFVMSDEALYYVGSDAKMYRIDLKTKNTSAVYQFQSHRMSGMQIVNDQLYIKDNQDWKVVNTSNTKYAVIFEN